MILGLIDEAVTAGARLRGACEVLGVDPRTVQRWKRQGIGEDRRAGPRCAPKNQLTPEERALILALLLSPAYRDLAVDQVVVRLADEGRYVGSPSTMRRLLKSEKLAAHRSAARPSTHSKPRELVATGPNQVWSWDITYLRSPVRGVFFYLYMVVDVWSRKVVAADVHLAETSELAAVLIRRACVREKIDPGQLALHSDHGGPMKGATLQVTLEVLGVVASFSRPRTSDDNPFSESLFKTVKYRPEYPSGPFESLEAARSWVSWFVRWYNTEHRHSQISFVTPEQRHTGEDIAILERRHELYEAARAKHPERWSGKTRNWSRVETVRLNPAKKPAATVAA
jgi:transposase InsO family protein